MTNRLSRVFFVFLLAALLLSACGGSVASKEPLRVEFTQWWSDYTLVIAKEKGLFEKYGVNVEPVLYAGLEGYSKIFTDLPEGKIDGGLLAIGDALVNSQSGALKVVAAYDDGGPNTVVALPEIASIADLKGKKVGAPRGTSYELFTLHMLSSGGLTDKDVTMVDVNPEDAAAKLASKEIAAAYVYFPEMAPGNHIIFQKSDAPGLFPDVIVFREEVVKNRPEDIRAFLKAWFEAVEWRNQNVAEARQIAAKYANLTLEEVVADDTLKLYTLQDNQQLFSASLGGAFSLPQAAQLNADFQTQAGFMPQPVDLTVFLDGSFLK